MGKCVKCGANFVGTPENPPADALCRYCEIQSLKSALEAAQAELKRVIHRSSARIERVEGILKMANKDWSDDHTHIQEACIKSGIPKEKVDGDGCGLPGIMDLTDMLVSELERCKEESVVEFIDNLIVTLESHGIDATNWDGEDEPHIIVANSIAAIINEKDAELERVKEQVRWRPIVTAPKDQTRIMLSDKDGFVEIGYWSTCVWVTKGGAWITFENRSDTFELNPTHWTPLPEPPKGTET